MTAAAQPIPATIRQAAGKGEARRLRNQGQVPAVAYGKGLTPTSIAVSPKDVLGALKSEHGQNSLLEIQLDGKSLLAMIKDYSYHPVSRKLLHVDFVEVKRGVPVNVEVPLILVGKAQGVAQGGTLRQVYRKVPVSCSPDQIPLAIEHDITALGVSQVLAAKDLKLADGVQVRLPAEQTLVTIIAPEKEREEASDDKPAKGKKK